MDVLSDGRSILWTPRVRAVQEQAARPRRPPSIVGRGWHELREYT